MYKIIIALFVSLLFYYIGCSSEKQPEVSEELISEMRVNADEFMSGLRDILVGQIQKNGLVAAVSVCSDSAQILTNNFSVEKGIYIKRVSFNNRNANNTPDNFESEGLNYFQQILDKGNLDTLSEYFKVIEENDVKSLRYMKPILLQAPCLNCHGPKDQIIPDVLQVINNRYENDKAVNYQIGDLRGAISIQKVF
jgi:hypothetical protein